MFKDSNITTQDLLRSVRQIEIKTSRIVNSYFAGQYHSAFKGQGIEFDEVRKYTVGDDVRAMDWKVSARYNEPFIKRFREERELSVVILADFSASTDFGFTKTKHNLIVELSALLSFSALKNNDKVGLLIFTDTVEKFIPLNKGKNHVLRIIRELIEFDPKSTQTNVANALEYFNRIQKRDSITFLITDACSELPKKEIDITRKRHDFIVCLVNDKLEYHLPSLGGTLVLSDLENNDYVYFDMSNKKIREEYFNEQNRIMEERLDFLKRNSIERIILDTSSDYVNDVMKFFVKRRR
ncbi:DUF58 domain-containing protein [Brachyspira hyodysenteriae]|uniref:von Willebrand factor type A (VWA) domain containing protein n=2 Tax=Brachyspira hyodysenteriae TaxID=159 RepID=A0A3B6V7X2_BRAHW|nr:DUF58 domain-containing protein [Brachyspira hyodysenteriae]ACN82620.1 von Willebrand factor type A (vWA) domain containing protein [Brachyspira hyodysenteriae WA1]ANN62748.1 hypothetical protein BHYOB78_02400 [Brachyspira hyodysenteriae ATCC 27164]AUJ50945.1 VWA domain-containing protein [Brachyspira hyodysenteriae]KLI13325.1 hypothetical protein SU45_12450 [Brachyspira hyodysenteriae]KLI14151.1 hypothetical protein SU46_11770 [Brachyspira hyodysenteriae]